MRRDGQRHVVIEGLVGDSEFHGHLQHYGRCVEQFIKFYVRGSRQ